MPLPDPYLLCSYLCARLNIDPRNERGSITTEIAIITALLVAAAVVVLGIIYFVARDTADSIPTPQPPS